MQNLLAYVQQNFVVDDVVIGLSFSFILVWMICSLM